jgi:hypothetical protein
VVVVVVWSFGVSVLLIIDVVTIDDSFSDGFVVVGVVVVVVVVVVVFVC